MDELKVTGGDLEARQAYIKRKEVGVKARAEVSPMTLGCALGFLTKRFEREQSVWLGLRSA